MELRAIACLTGKGLFHTAQARKEALYENVQAAIELGIITGDAASLCSPEESTQSVPRFRLLP